MAGRFRQRLVALIDELIDDPPPEGESFLLDGQGIVLEDYLAVRPERRDRLMALLRSGQLEAGPWYVLADELIPSAEALVRNLLMGRRVLASLGADSQPVLYCPDAFGHPAALPELANGFGLPLIIAWRGFGSRRWPRGDTFHWRAPSGASAVLFHLPRSGYEFGSSLPSDDRGAAERWERMCAELEPRSSTGVLLVQNGADHHARQRHYRQALAALEGAAGRGVRVQGSSMRRFTSELLAALKTTNVPTVREELRDSYGYTWTLQGTFATRAHQKRANARAERTLIREAEPFAAVARAHGAISRVPLLNAAWRTLLQAHPHDTLCGCSIDPVANAMNERVTAATDMARAIVEDALLDLLGHDRENARTRRADWRPAVVVRNAAPRPRGGIAFVNLDMFVRDVPVGPGSAPSTGEDQSSARVIVPPIAGAAWMQLLGKGRLVNDRVESPRHYPDNDLVARVPAAIWIDDVPAYGLTALPMEQHGGRGDVVPSGRTVPAALARVRGLGREGLALENGRVRLIAHNGYLTFEDVITGRIVHHLVAVEDRIDRGDLYTPSVRGTRLVPRLDDARVLHTGPLVASWRLRWDLIDPAHPRRNGAAFVTDFSLHAESPALRLSIQGTNLRGDHRLRIGLRTGIRHYTVWADAAFGPVHRVPLDTPQEEAAVEQPPATAPLHRYVSLFGPDEGATIFSDGLAEYEATIDGTVYVTLARAVGQLSRNDLPERPGHAGWPTPTPSAQSIGRFSASLGLMLHGPRSDAMVALIERTADDVLLPLRGGTLRSSLDFPPPVSGGELFGKGLAFSALKESEDGTAIVARCVNLLEHEVDGAWEFGFSIHAAHRARLDETPLEPLHHEGDRVLFRAGAREVVTILVIPTRR